MYLFTVSGFAGGSLRPWGLLKYYDIAYSDQGGQWNDYCRKWTLAKPSLKALIDETNATVLLPGRDLVQTDNSFTEMCSA